MERAPLLKNPRGKRQKFSKEIPRKGGFGLGNHSLDQWGTLVFLRVEYIFVNDA